MPTKTHIMERDYNAASVAPTAAPAVLLDYYYATTYRNVTELVDETRSIEIDTDLYERVLARIDTVGNWVSADEVLGQPDNA